MPEAIGAAILSGLPHGFLTRRGGVSSGIAAGLNVGLGSGDDGEAVMENRRRAARAVLPGARLVTVYQVHSPDAAIVDEPWSEDARPRADALVTRRRGLVLGIVTADCAPVLLADRAAGVVGAAHAGWKGARGGVIESAVAAMEALGARRDGIVAAIGPCIAQASYEVGQDFRERFGPGDQEFFAPGRAGHYQFDLEGFVARRLADAGVGGVERLGLDTYADEERFFSYRRATHRGEGNYGRQFSLIGLAA
ncbi:peptidoglycan editing factor PgeF [Tsuneonella sp. CC-YZS046]|uniref:peptidoglycan editing factor PgeF n=1 Tax=Tsuneonella sp. CC-YZS046 TaxID=3042152 RepID=UPI002D7670F8|nr:peptidoglycan editing factor PgeF [Tsuneonella sp. CC-YZS046]WRO68220.1 peptidoglycan editing factor PgeF [Tsuneonella sp. CC-YZS046]